jgi:hypothetical protein
MVGICLAFLWAVGGAAEQRKPLLLGQITADLPLIRDMATRVGNDAQTTALVEHVFEHMIDLCFRCNSHRVPAEKWDAGHCALCADFVWSARQDWDVFFRMWLHQLSVAQKRLVAEYIDKKMIVPPDEPRPGLLRALRRSLIAVGLAMVQRPPTQS